MGAEVSATKDALEDLNREAAQVTEFENRIKSFLGLAGAAEVLKRAVRDAMATIKELDATMTEMSVVTDLTVGDYWDQLPEYSQRASDLGISINSAYKAATLYYQQGLKTNEVNAISAETLKMAKIAGLDAAEATDKMTAALRGFNMELNETSAQRVADVYSELAAITAADTKEIANAMTKTASIASNAGMEFETTAAFLSQIIETTRESAETAGTAMKTVIARFQELKKDPSEVGEVEGEIVDANKIETALRSVGVALRDSNGQFRDLDDVFLELASKWETLDTNTQRYIATIAAGSRQQSRFIAMMSNYGRTQELVAAANNSAGASNKQFEKTMDSLEAKIAKLENAWHEFTMGIMNSDLVKTGIDILTKLLEIINKATNGFNGLAGSITKILGIVAVFKLGKTIFNKLREPMVKFFADIVREAGMTGERAGNAAKAGLERSK
jgi:TP901 family phage tail tape measure protein